MQIIFCSLPIQNVSASYAISTQLKTELAIIQQQTIQLVCICLLLTERWLLSVCINDSQTNKELIFFRGVSGKNVQTVMMKMFSSQNQRQTNITSNIFFPNSSHIFN